MRLAVLCVMGSVASALHMGQPRLAATRQVRLCTMCASSQPRFSLPPAARRDVAAEAIAASSLLRKDHPVLARDAAAAAKDTRPLAMLCFRDGSFAQLVGEVIDHITSGRQAGKTWIRPLAIRQSSNVSLAIAAERFDPTIGWLDAQEGGVPSRLHIFSPLAPAAFVPTHQLEELPQALTLAIRTMSDAHASANAEAHLEAATQSDDFFMLQSFMRRLDDERPPGDDKQPLFDPFA